MPADNAFMGKPYPLSTRVALKNVLGQAAELGFGFNLGIECEIFLLRPGANGQLEIPDAEDRLIKPCYDVRSFLNSFGWLDKIASCMNDLDWGLYGARARSSMLFLNRVLRYAGGEVELVAEDVHGRPDIDQLLAGTPPEARIYCCGPAGLLQAVQEAAARCGRANHLRIERFSSDKPTQGHEPAAFDVVLARSGMTLHVPPDRTLGEVLRAAGAPIYFSCESGCCGTCRTHVLEGIPEHNDVLMDDEERAESGDMMVCVGRAKCAKLVLDL